MNLYCFQHDANHKLTPSQAEKVIYALSGEVASALCEPDGDRIYAGEDGYKHIPCPIGMLQMAGDSEGYGELVESCVDSRRDLERRATPGGEPA
jgi:hypothetical protein